MDKSKIFENYQKDQQSINKYRIDPRFSHTDGDLFLCPSCKKKELKVDWENLFTWEKPDSEKNKYQYMEDQQYWDREWSDYEFSGRLKCHCGEMVAIAGVAEELQEFPPEEDIDFPYYEYKYQIKYFSKALQSFWGPKDMPALCVKLLNDAFALFHINRDAAGNRLRVLLELVADEQLSSNGYTPPSQLNNKLGRLHQVLPDIIGLAELCRIIGNDASHGHEINEQELTEAFYYMSHLLDRVYGEEYAMLRFRHPSK